MIDVIIKLFFEKKKKAVEKPKTIIMKNRRDIELSRANEEYFKKIKTPDQAQTCLSGYFKNIKGLNYIERTKSLPIAIIEGQSSRQEFLKFAYLHQ